MRWSELGGGQGGGSPACDCPRIPSVTSIPGTRTVRESTWEHGEPREDEQQGLPGPAGAWEGLGDPALKVSGHLLWLRTAARAPGPGGKGAREEAAASQAWSQPAWGTSRRVSGFIRKKCAPPLNVARWCKYVPAIFGTYLYLKGGGMQANKLLTASAGLFPPPGGHPDPHPRSCR